MGVYFGTKQYKIQSFQIGYGSIFDTSYGTLNEKLITAIFLVQYPIMKQFKVLHTVNNVINIIFLHC